MKYTYFAKVENGKTKIEDRIGFDNCIASFDGKEISITIEKKSAQGQALKIGTFME